MDKEERLKKLLKGQEDYNNRAVKVEATQSMVAKKVLDIVSKYGYKEIKDFKNVLALEESKKAEVEEILSSKEAELEQKQTALREVESVINASEY